MCPSHCASAPPRTPSSCAAAQPARPCRRAARGGAPQNRTGRRAPSGYHHPRRGPLPVPEPHPPAPRTKRAAHVKRVEKGLDVVSPLNNCSPLGRARTRPTHAPSTKPIKSRTSPRLHAVDGRDAISPLRRKDRGATWFFLLSSLVSPFRRRGERRDRAAAGMWRRAMLLALLVRCRSAHGPMLAVCGRRRSSGAGRRRPWRQKQSACSGFWAQFHLRRRSIVCWSLMLMAPDRRSRDDQIHLLASGRCGAYAPAERGVLVFARQPTWQPAEQSVASMRRQDV